MKKKTLGITGSLNDAAQETDAYSKFQDDQSHPLSVHDPDAAAKVKPLTTNPASVFGKPPRL